MIDIENEVFDDVATRLRAEYEGIYVSGDHANKPKSFPAVYLEERDNYVFERARSSSGIENAVQVMYEADIYSNKRSGRKLEAKSIAATVDSVMVGLGFTRTSRTVVPSGYDSTIYRVVCRYEAVVGHRDDGGFLVYLNNP